MKAKKRRERYRRTFNFSDLTSSDIRQSTFKFHYSVEFADHTMVRYSYAVVPLFLLLLSLRRRKDTSPHPVKKINKSPATRVPTNREQTRLQTGQAILHSTTQLERSFSAAIIYISGWGECCGPEVLDY